MTPPTPTPVLACCGAPDRPGWSLHASWCQAAADARYADVQARYASGIHPTYPVRPGDPEMDRCVCGGVRHWHAKAPYGCDDCSCRRFASFLSGLSRAVAR